DRQRTRRLGILEVRAGDARGMYRALRPLSAAEEPASLRLTRAIGVRRARDRQAGSRGVAWGTRRTGVARADAARRRAAAAACEGVESLVPAERAEHVRLVRQVDGRLRDHPRGEDEADRQRTQAGRRR